MRTDQNEQQNTGNFVEQQETQYGQIPHFSGQHGSDKKNQQQLGSRTIAINLTYSDTVIKITLD